MGCVLGYPSGEPLTLFKPFSSDDISESIRNMSLFLEAKN